MIFGAGVLAMLYILEPSGLGSLPSGGSEKRSGKCEEIGGVILLSCSRFEGPGSAGFGALMGLKREGEGISSFSALCFCYVIPYVTSYKFILCQTLS
jgi:hypothetical protein